MLQLVTFSILIDTCKILSITFKANTCTFGFEKTPN